VVCEGDARTLKTLRARPIGQLIEERGVMRGLPEHEPTAACEQGAPDPHVRVDTNDYSPESAPDRSGSSISSIGSTTPDDGIQPSDISHQIYELRTSKKRTIQQRRLTPEPQVSTRTGSFIPLPSQDGQGRRASKPLCFESWPGATGRRRLDDRSL
jgi:hypothetical protein